MLTFIPHEQTWRARVAGYIREQAQPVEKYGHQPRLYALACAVGAGSAYDDDVVYAAAWLHDLGVFVGHRPEDPELLTRWDNMAYAVAKVPELLARFGFPAEKVEAVVACIRTHQASADPVSVEAVILRDADILEQLGAVGIARTLCKIGRDTRFRTFTEAAVVLERALLELPGKLRLASAQKLAEERVRMHRTFLDGLLWEAGAELH